MPAYAGIVIGDGGGTLISIKIGDVLSSMVAKLACACVAYCWIGH
jgi:hypothetical protein